MGARLLYVKPLWCVSSAFSRLFAGVQTPFYLRGGRPTRGAQVKGAGEQNSRPVGPGGWELVCQQSILLSCS